MRFSRRLLLQKRKFKMASAAENFSDQKSGSLRVGRRVQSKRHSESVGRTCLTIYTRRLSTFRRNCVECRHIVRLRCGPAARRKAGVTKMAATVIGATRRRRLLVASNHGTATVIRAPARRTDEPVSVSRVFHILCPRKPMT